MLGLAYKPDVDDLRESPAIEVAHLLAEEGAVVKAYEPFRPDYLLEGVTMSTNLADTLVDAEILLLLVGHAQFTALDPVEVAKLTPARLVFDTVNGWHREAWNLAGFRVEKLGDRKNSSR